MSFLRVAAAGLAIAVSLCLAFSDQSYARTAHPAKARGGSSAHLYVLLGLGNNSPGLAEFGARIGRRGVPTTVRNHGEWQTLAQEAIEQYKSGRLRSIMIVGHSLGGSAASEMAAELGRAGVPVQLVVMLDPVGGSEVPSNVRRAAKIFPGAGEDHFSVIAAHDRELNNYVLGAKAGSVRTVARKRRTPH